MDTSLPSKGRLVSLAPYCVCGGVVGKLPVW